MRDMSNKSAKARMGASVRRGVDPKKGGQWITGTWDGGTWSAMVFSEPSEAYGIPEFPHISKLAINPKDKPGIGGVIVNYDRGWDIKPSTPELQKAYREIAQAATAEVKKAVKQGWYARTGSKEEMAAGEPDLRSFRLPGEIADVRKKINDYTRALENDLRSGKYTTAAARCKAIGAMYGPGGGSLSWFYEEYADALKNRGYARSGNKTKFAQPPFSASDLNALKRLVQQYDQKAKTSKGVRTETGMNAEWEAISIANHLREIVGYAQVGQTHRAYAQVRMSSLDVVRILPASLVKAAQEVTKLSRPGAKVTAEKATMAAPTPHKVTVTDKSGTARTYMVSDRVLRSIEGTKKQAEARGTAPAYDDVIRLGTKMGEVVEASKAKAANPQETPAMRELNRKMYELLQKGDRLLKQSLSASVSGEESQRLRDEVERISEQLDAMGEDLMRQRKAAGFAKSSDLEREDVKAGLKLMEKADKAVSDKIRTLIAEGKPQDQAVAIALDMKRRGEI